MPSVLRRMFRPLLWWLVASSLFFLAQFHRTQARKATLRFTVSMEGRSGQIIHEAKVNGSPYEAGKPSGVGRKGLVVQAADAESFETCASQFLAG
jgi:hypothetical protein